MRIATTYYIDVSTLGLFIAVGVLTLVVGVVLVVGLVSFRRKR